MTLTRALFPSMSWTTRLLLVLAGTVFIALAARITVPMAPVPMTLQTLAILVVGFTFGSRLGALTLVAYLAEGAAGLPVFANGGGGLTYMTGPTGGFLVGFVAMAWIAGFAAERGLARSFPGALAFALLASAAVYVPGILWPLGIAGAAGQEGGWIGRSLDAYYWPHYVQPFLVGDSVKSAIAALAVTGGWAALRRR